MSEKPPKTPWGKCDGCGKPAPVGNLWPLDDGRNVCLDCAMVLPAAPEPGSSEMDRCLAEVDAVYYARLLSLARIAANVANWTAQNQAGDLRVWKPHPPLHVTARRLLEEIEG